MNKTRLLPLAALLLGLGLTSAGAQTATDDHSAHAGHGSAPAAAPPATTGATPARTTAPASPAPAAAAPSTPSTAAAPAAAADRDMAHGAMQGGRPPADARDPHGYSGGTQRGSGTYALPGSRPLQLMDQHHFGSLLLNRLERVHADEGSATAYDAQAWFGSDANRLVLKAEGERAHGRLQEARTELLWGHAVAAYWDTQLGLRQDSGEGPGRSWLAFGVQGLAPYWFELDATVYVGEGGRTALRLGAEYELLLTQRLVLQPRLELAAYGQDDPARHLGSGLSSGVAGLRLRYEFSRQFAPYLGVERSARLGKTADLARAAGEPRSQTRWVAGLRLWY